MKDPNVNVRKTTLMVITHLILNGMLKLKSEICDVALLLQDEELRIRNFRSFYIRNFFSIQTQLQEYQLPTLHLQEN